MNLYCIKYNQNRRIFLSLSKLFFLVSILGGSGFLESCDVPNNLGLNFIQGSDITTNDTLLEIQACVIRFDSVNTSDPNTIFFGKRSDLTFGKTSTKTYTNLGLPFVVAVETDSIYIYDSLVMSMNISAYYGDTLQPQTYGVYNLNTEISDQTIFYAFDSIISINSTPIATFTFDAADDTLNNIRFKLDDKIGNDLFAHLIDSSELTTEEVQSVLPSIMIRAASDDNSLILGVPVNAALIFLYYHTENIDTVPMSNLISFGTRFVNIENDFSNTPLKALNTEKQVPIDVLNNIGYIQPGLGIGLRINFPGLKSLRNSNTTVNEATLKLNISPDNNFEVNPPSNLLIAYGGNSVNEIARDVNNLDSLVFIFGSTATSNLSYNSNSRLYLPASINNYVRSVLNGTTDNGLVIYPGRFLTTLSFEQVEFEIFSSTLQTFYTTFQN